MDSPVCLRLHWIKAVPVFIRIHELKWSIASVTGLAQVSFDGLRATDVLAHLMGMDSPVCLRLHWIKAVPVFSRIHKLRFPRARTMNPARHMFVALHDVDELVRMKARHAEVRLTCALSSRHRKLLRFVRHVLRQSCARTRLRAALRLKFFATCIALRTCGH